MLSSFTTRFRSLIWFLIFSFSLYCMPNLELVFPYKISLFPSEAEASEAQPPEPPIPLPQEAASEQTAEKAEPSPTGPSSATTSSSSEAMDAFPSTLSFKVDDFTGASHMSYPISVPPARGGLAPQLSLNYSSSGGMAGWE